MDNNTSVTFSELEILNKLVLALHDENLSVRSRMVNFLHMVMDLVPFERGSIFFFYKNAEGLYEKHSSVDVNWNNSYIQQYDDICCHIDDTLPFLDSDYPLIFKSSSFFNQDERTQTKFWKDYLLPNNCIYSLEANILLESAKNLRCSLSFFRGTGSQDFSDDELKIMKFFQPHISSLVKNYGEEVDNTSGLLMLEDCDCIGLCILDNNYQLLRTNSKFKALMSVTDDEILKQSVCLCQNYGNVNQNLRHVSIKSKLEQYPLFLEVQKISDPQTKHTAGYCCLIYDLSYMLNHTLHQVQIKYALSKKELGILMLVLEGKTNEEISSLLFLSIPTIKKYLASIYCKMEIKSQKQIFEKLKLL